MLEKTGHGPFVAVGVRWQHGRIRAAPQGPAQGHGFADAALVSLIAHVVHGGASGAGGRDDYRSIPQPAVHHTLHRHGKVGHVQVNDRAVHFG